MSKEIRREIHTTPLVKVWRYEHRWGTLIGDTRDLVVTRTDKGRMTISYGRGSVEIREELVDILAEMVAEAAAWKAVNDEATDSAPTQGPEAP